MVTDDLCYLSANEALRLFTARELSPVELMRAMIARTEQAEPVINAFTERLFESALAQAALAAQRYLARGGLEPRPLEGIPVAAKEKHAIAGLSLTEGCLAQADVVATENAPVIDRILGAGGIIHARTATPEFSVTYVTHTRMWGVTRNPWNTDFTPGGSSGGSGASLAAGTTLLATGSDIGGSTRIPAAFCGVVGFKAPYGRNPGAVPLALDHYRGDGPLARTVADCALFQNALCGPDPRDHTSLRPKLVLPSVFEPVGGMRIALCIRLGDYVVHEEIEANTRAVASALTQAGAEVTEIALPWTKAEVSTAVNAHFARIFGAMVGETAVAHREQMCSYTVRFADAMAAVRGQISYLDGLRIEARMQAQLAEAMAPYDVLLCPSSSVPGLPAADDLSGPLVINGTDYGDPVNAAMTSPFNICNRCPVLNVPGGRSSWGLPTGVQIVGHTYDDPAVFRVGTAIEQLRPWTYNTVIA